MLLRNFLRILLSVALLWSLSALSAEARFHADPLKFIRTHSSQKSDDTSKKLVIVICSATGNQGQAICERFHQLVNRPSAIKKKQIELRGLTRNKDSPKAMALAEKYKGLLTLYSIDHNDPKSMEEAFEDANALYLNGAMSKDESLVYEKILEAAVQAKRNGASMNHIIYSSSVECQRDHGVPHWETCRRTEEYLRNLQTTDECSDLTVHFVRFAHCNENLVNYFAPSKSGWMAFPWDVSARTPTASVKDGARVTCRLFLDPKLMNNGESVDIVTDFASPSDMAAEVSRVQGRKVQAYKGPWILLHVVNHLFWEPKTIVIMGKFLETNDLSKDFASEPDKIRVLLKDEINNGEPLESVAAFCERSFSKFE